jgi:hypothetical protein
MREDGPSGNGNLKKFNYRLHIGYFFILIFIVGLEFSYNYGLIEWSIRVMRFI